MEDCPKNTVQDSLSTQSSAWSSLSLPAAQQVIKVQKLRNILCQGVGDGLKDVTKSQRI